MALLGIGILCFAIGSFVPNAVGGILALLSAVLLIFLFLFTTSESAAGPGEEVRRSERPEARVCLPLTCSGQADLSY